MDLENIKKRDKEIGDGYKIVIYDVYDIMIDLLEESEFLENCIDMEKNDGMDYLIESVNSLLKMNEETLEILIVNEQNLERIK